jgi:hypothetical protein
MRTACWITKDKDTHSPPSIAVAKNGCTCTSTPSPITSSPHGYLSMGATLCCMNRIFRYVALRRWVNGDERFDRTRWIQRKSSRGPLILLHLPLQQSGRRHNIPAKCRALLTQWRCVISHETSLVKTQPLGTLPSNAKKHKSWGRQWCAGGQLTFWNATNHGTAGVTDKFTPEYTSAVLQVKTSYQLEKWFRDILRIPRSKDRSIHMILAPCLLYTTKAMREGHTSCWSWRCTIDTRVFVSISADRQPAPPRRAGYRRQVKVTRSIWRADKLVDKFSNQAWKNCTKVGRRNADLQT